MRQGERLSERHEARAPAGERGSRKRKRLTEGESKRVGNGRGRRERLTAKIVSYLQTEGKSWGEGEADLD